MSSTLAPSILSPNNPITESSVLETFSKLNLKCPEKDLKDYTSLLTGIWEVWNNVGQMEDYVPSVDEERFPRENIREAKGDENKSNAWGWKCHIEDKKKVDGKRGLLDGVTICLKDNVAVKGVPCTLGTDFFEGWIPNTDATIVTRILEAGGIINGKAMCENLSLWGVSLSSRNGQINNPHAHGFSAGGSSSGTGALVALGESDMGIGGDQGGSIRLPSSLNGLVGLKPTTGLVPYTGIASLEPVIDSAGPMTKTVLDNALLLQVIAGADGIDDRQLAGCPFPDQVPDYPSLAKQGVKGMRIGILKEGFDQPLADLRVSKFVETAAREFEKLGAIVEEVSVPMHRVAPEIWAVGGRMSATTSLLGKNCGRRQLCMNDLTEKMLPITQEKLEKMFPSAVNTIINGQWGWDNMPPGLMGKATNLIRKLKDEYYKALDKYDVLITPTLPFLAPKLIDPKSASVTELMINSAGLSLNTSAFNITGLPALSLPVGFLSHPLDENAKLPIGMQIISKFYQEPTIYRCAYAWEKNNDWKEYSAPVNITATI